jgi:glyoxylase-like metal-dependent hydrolase (beta-lactamase superfamily II)
MRVGDIEVTALCDGFVTLSGAYPTLPQWRDHEETIRTEGRLPLPVGCFVVRTPTDDGVHTTLIDAGIGEFQDPVAEGGRLPQQLAAAGIAPEDVDTVFLTHLHWDHAAGVTTGGEPTYPNAVVRVGAADWEWFGAGGNGPEAVTASMRRLDELGMLQLIEQDGEEIAPGLTGLSVPGHAPGMFGAVISSNGSRVVFVADAVHRPGQVFDPTITLTDMDPEHAIATRTALLAQLEADDDVWTGSHFPGLAFGRIVRTDGVASFVALTEESEAAG